jgi:hypothetical protein
VASGNCPFTSFLDEIVSVRGIACQGHGKPAKLGQQTHEFAAYVVGLGRIVHNSHINYVAGWCFIRAGFKFPSPRIQAPRAARFFSVKQERGKVKAHQAAGACLDVSPVSADMKQDQHVMQAPMETKGAVSGALRGKTTNITIKDCR